MREVLITKDTGEREVFNAEKLRNSLRKSRAAASVADEIVHTIEKEIQPRMTTEHIYRRAFQLLNEKQSSAAMKYSIRRSVLNLGPTGFPFEAYIAELFAAQGYQTRTGQMLKGGCIEHEVDVIAWNDQKLLLAEVKFHNELTMKSDAKVALYVKARFDDLYNGSFRLDGKDRTLTRGLLITNTKFTETAKRYVECVNTFDIISWDYPQKGNLYDLIEQTGLHPMTCLPTLSVEEKQALLKRGITQCQSLKQNKNVLKEIGVSQKNIDAVVECIDSLSTTP
jgi:hypothetical protein